MRFYILVKELDKLPSFLLNDEYDSHYTKDKIVFFNSEKRARMELRVMRDRFPKVKYRVKYSILKELED